ncbi:MAG TPA: helix-turn-helix transcriptional regulator, partial [Thermoanaerobaculia bacterium]
MPRKPPPPPLSTALTLLRTIQGWPQNELAAALGCGATLLCDYEAGRKLPSRERLEEAAAVLGLPPEAVDRALACVQSIRALSTPTGPAATANPRTEAAVARVTASAEAFARAIMALDAAREAEEERRRAQGLWLRLERHPPARRRRLVEGTREFRSWALCELVCEQSLKAAADRAERALELAALAVRIAELVPGEEG